MVTLPDFTKQSTQRMGVWSAAKATVGQLIPSGSDFTAASAAAFKAAALSDILQTHFQARSQEFNDKDIQLTDVKSAILYARGKKSTKAMRKVILGGAKLTAATLTTASGATIGSVIPVAGTAVGAIAGLGLGKVVGYGISGIDFAKRGIKKAYKIRNHTLGVHRQQAAACLLNMMNQTCGQGRGSNPAKEAIEVILGIEYDIFFKERMTPQEQMERLALRMKSV